MKKKLSLLVLAITIVCMLAACTSAPAETGTEKPANPAPDAGKIILATTTSTENSGLLDYLLPEFKYDTGYDVDVIAVGTGAALQKGVDGEADVLLVHARTSEDEFMAAGNGVDRYDVMHNDFILVGPKDDPLKIKETSGSDIAASMKAIADNKATFVSRGDDSGTHKKELAIWKASEITPEGDWYVEAGKGMGDVLQMANEMQGYTISDRATYLSMKDTLDLVIVCEGDENMLNPYGVITVDPKKNDQINYDGAKAFADWLVSPRGQKLISEYGVEEFGSPLFFPDAIK